MLKKHGIGQQKLTCKPARAGLHRAGHHNPLQLNPGGFKLGIFVESMQRLVATVT